MNERLEKNIERYFCDEVKKLEGITIKIGKNGNPDRLALLPYQLSYLVELKSKTGKLSPLQRRVHNKIHGVGHPTWTLGTKSQVDSFITNVKHDLKQAKDHSDFVNSL